MPNQVTGRLVEIGQTLQIPTKNGGQPFTKRDFLLDARTYDPYTGELSEYENLLPLELSGDRCADLDRYRTGDVVTVSFALQGRTYTNTAGEMKRILGVRCYKIEPHGKPSRQQPPVQSFSQPYSPFQPQTDETMPNNDLPF